MAALAGLSFRTVQLMESGAHDPKISTLGRIATAMGLPPRIVERHLEMIFQQPSDSVFMISERIREEGEDSWKIWLLNFVDAFRQHVDASYINMPPRPGLPPRMHALIASTVETLCEELSMAPPAWCRSVPGLARPWFVAETENLKASALAESPIHFRKRNIFVLENMLSRR